MRGRKNKTADEKQTFVSRVKELIDAGATAKQACEDVGGSMANYHRWVKVFGVSTSPKKSVKAVKRVKPQLIQITGEQVDERVTILMGSSKELQNVLEKLRQVNL